ncbi:hypothetical protein CEXT_162931 [Caerostris extrusa]|uniref:Uncharacterized protein n=1 Tax=Caerostris extrusa TaxID=172846 RepID=A0AAV4THW9_CAEEX|nr:hypothetical protein CEXT_162931 [Caerostris extrusa]
MIDIQVNSLTELLTTRVFTPTNSKSNDNLQGQTQLKRELSCLLQILGSQFFLHQINSASIQKLETLDAFAYDAWLPEICRRIILYADFLLWSSTVLNVDLMKYISDIKSPCVEFSPR